MTRRCFQLASLFRCACGGVHSTWRTWCFPRQSGNGRPIHARCPLNAERERVRLEHLRNYRRWAQPVGTQLELTEAM